MFSSALAPCALKLCIRCSGSLFLRRIEISSSYKYSLFSFTGNQLFPTLFAIGLYGLLFFHVLDKLTGTRLFQLQSQNKCWQPLDTKLPSHMQSRYPARTAFVASRSISSVQLFSFHTSYSSTCYRTHSLYLALHEVLSSTNLLGTVPISLQKQSKNQHIELNFFVFLFCIWKVSVLNLGLKTCNRDMGAFATFLPSQTDSMPIHSVYPICVLIYCLFNCALSRPVYCLLVVLVQ